MTRYQEYRQTVQQMVDAEEDELERGWIWMANRSQLIEASEQESREYLYQLALLGKGFVAVVAKDEDSARMEATDILRRETYIYKEDDKDLKKIQGPPDKVERIKEGVFSLAEGGG